MVLDLNAKISAEDLLAQVRSAWPSTAMLVLAPQDDPARGLRSLKLGAYDVLLRPLEGELVEAALLRAVEKWQMAEELRAARAREEAPAVLLGDSAATRGLRDDLNKAATQDGNVLLLGETGTGKALAARVLHRLSPRKRGPFVTLRCAAVEPGQMEALLFGSERQPSPAQPSLGRLEQALGGTLYLDHVDFLSADLQEKLLRCLQDRGHYRLGGARFIPTDIRVVASASPQLRKRVDDGQFREDLYWRLGATLLTLPPLRERADDIPDLFHVFVARRCRSMRRPVPVIRPEAVDALQAHPFPGNVGELEALSDLAASLAGDEIGLTDLPIPVFLRAETGGRGLDMPLKQAVHAFERQVILRTLKAVKGNQSRAADRLKIHRNTLILKMQEFGIPNRKTVGKVRK